MIFPLDNFKILRIFSKSGPRVVEGGLGIKKVQNSNFFFFETFPKLGDVYAKMWVIPNPDVASNT